MISNIFFGVKSYEELKMKLDLMAWQPQKIPKEGSI
jgi:hypothetical protein